jgi:TPR repeat protein
MGSCNSVETLVVDDMAKARHFIIKRDYKSAVPYLKKCVDLGNSHASFLLGSIYVDFLENEKEGIELLENAVIRNNHTAMAYLGIKYTDDKSLDYDPITGYLYLIAAYNKGTNVSYNLALCYHHGIGITQNMKKAIYYYIIAKKTNMITEKEFLKCVGNLSECDTDQVLNIKSVMSSSLLL